MADPVCPDEGIQRNVTLGQPPGVLQGSRRRVDVLGRDPVFQQMQQRGDVPLDAGPEKFDDDVVPAKLGDAQDQPLTDVLTDGHEPAIDCRGHARQSAIDRVAAAVHRTMLGAATRPDATVSTTAQRRSGVSCPQPDGAVRHSP
jgi:hypothetical protein